MSTRQLDGTCLIVTKASSPRGENVHFGKCAVLTRNSFLTFTREQHDISTTKIAIIRYVVGTCVKLFCLFIPFNK